MDLLSLLGWILAAAFISISIMMGKNPETGKVVLIVKQFIGFIDPGSIMIVVGGTISSLMVSFPLSDFAKIPKHLKIVLFPTKYNPIEYIEQITTFAKEARINGLLALEDKLNQVSDPFLKNSLLLVVDSVEPEKVKDLLNNELDYLDERHSQSLSFYLKASDYAPAFGMIGTLVGLINLLANLQDIDALAANMAVALVTTFYGVIMANVIFKPVANKLKKRHEEEYLCKMIISEGVQSIQDGDNPTFIQDKLMRLLPVSYTDNASGGKSKGKSKSKKK